MENETTKQLKKEIREAELLNRVKEQERKIQENR